MPNLPSLVWALIIAFVAVLVYVVLFSGNAHGALTPTCPCTAVSLTSTRLVVDADGFTPDTPVGVSFHYAPDDGSPGRTGSIDLDGGTVTPGQWTGDTGAYRVAISRRQVITSVPGELVTTVVGSDGVTATQTVEVAG